MWKCSRKIEKRFGQKSKEADGRICWLCRFLSMRCKNSIFLFCKLNIQPRSNLPVKGVESAGWSVRRLSYWKLLLFVQRASLIINSQFGCRDRHVSEQPTYIPLIHISHKALWFSNQRERVCGLIDILLFHPLSKQSTSLSHLLDTCINKKTVGVLSTSTLTLTRRGALALTLIPILIRAEKGRPRLSLEHAMEEQRVEWIYMRRRNCGPTKKLTFEQEATNNWIYTLLKLIHFYSPGHLQRETFLIKSRTCF